MKVSLNSAALLPEIHLFHDSDKAEKFLRKHGCKEVMPEWADGQTWYLTGPYPIAVVVIRNCDRDRRDVDALIVHEATHVALDHFSYIGEDEPAHEEFAYLMQIIAGALFTAHDKWENKQDHLTVDGEPAPETKAAEVG